MTKLVVGPTRPFLTFLCLTMALRTTQVQSYMKTVKCLIWKFSVGEIITVSVYDDSWFCGSSTGRYFVIWDNLLFHLMCVKGSKNPNQARVVMLDMSDQQTRYQTFGDGMMCNVQSPEGVSTGDAPYYVVDRLRGSYVPYDKSKCNSKHYIEYLAYGSTRGAKDDCPVFAPFSASSSIQRGFKLAGKNGLSFDWPAEGAMMQPTSRPSPVTKKRSSSNPLKSPWNPLARLTSPKTSSISSPQQGVRKSPRLLAGTAKAVDRKGGGGGGHFSGGRGGGFHGGGEGESAGSGTGGRGGVNPAVVAGANSGAHRQSSAASRSSPLPFKIPKLRWGRKGSGK